MVWLSLYLCREDQAKEEAFESLKKKEWEFANQARGEDHFRHRIKKGLETCRVSWYVLSKGNI